ncbi:metallophosphoesterase [Erythrobacteraceae bacterium CFH 75059]|uniref:metallophosphoesterase family protein n=1 Tax=Qipengyuania thermophila TaxID=2509361 RepID=UPI00101FF2DF|nr:metallophosphoesterase [Qipengyuania thermophila]TCD06675.1 metallophosphoesterase [Erythrobacteraceae bacterium CFH 75059]
MATDGTLLFHISDIHWGLEDRRALAWARAEMERLRPAAVVITGDLTMRARHREFRAATAWIDALDLPVTVEVGNHDLPYFNPVERFVDPYRRFQRVRSTVERVIELPNLAIVPLKTVRRWQPRWPWSEGWITPRALAQCLARIDALPAGTRTLVAAHHPLVERDREGRLLTHGGTAALEALASRGVVGVLSGHVHDPFDLEEQTGSGSVRMIGAGTLSQRLRSTPPSFNELHWDGARLHVRVRTLDAVPTADMQIDDVPKDALPPRQPGEPVAPVGAVPAVDPPVH